MVNRRAASGAPFNAAEAVTAAEAVRAYTYGSAYASKAEHLKGSVTPGKLADLVVVSEGPDRGQSRPHRGPGSPRHHRRR
jgi:predicted amidohydrolase YtcJ